MRKRDGEGKVDGKVARYRKRDRALAGVRECLATAQFPHPSSKLPLPYPFQASNPFPPTSAQKATKEESLWKTYSQI